MVSRTTRKASAGAYLLHYSCSRYDCRLSLWACSSSSYLARYTPFTNPYTSQTTTYTCHEPAAHRRTCAAAVGALCYQQPYTSHEPTLLSRTPTPFMDLSHLAPAQRQLGPKGCGDRVVDRAWRIFLQGFVTGAGVCERCGESTKIF